MYIHPYVRSKLPLIKKLSNLLFWVIYRNLPVKDLRGGFCPHSTNHFYHISHQNSVKIPSKVAVTDRQRSSSLAMFIQ